MFAYFKSPDLSAEFIAVRIGGARWHECPALRLLTRVVATKQLRAARKRKAIAIYYVHRLSLHAY